MDQPLALGVQRRRGLVQQQDADAVLTQQRSSYGDTLPLLGELCAVGIFYEHNSSLSAHYRCEESGTNLTARELDATVAHQRVVAVLEQHDEVVCVGLPRRLFNLLLQTSVESQPFRNRHSTYARRNPTCVTAPSTPYEMLRAMVVEKSCGSCAVSSGTLYCHRMTTIITVTTII